MTRVTALYIHLIKSCAATLVPELSVLKTGLQWDRQWMLVDSMGKFLSQRTLPTMALIRPRLEADMLVVSAPNLSDLNVPLDYHFQDIRAALVHSYPVNGYDEGDAAAEWFSRFLGQPCRLLRASAHHARFSPDGFGSRPAQLGFADAFPILLTSQTSLIDLNAHLTKPVRMEAFRPNIVVSNIVADGNDLAAFAEDAWIYFSINGVHLEAVKPCQRCSIPGLDPSTGERYHPKLLKELVQHRGVANFGMNCNHLSEGLIRVGDAVLTK